MFRMQLKTDDVDAKPALDTFQQGIARLGLQDTLSVRYAPSPPASRAPPELQVVGFETHDKSMQSRQLSSITRLSEDVCSQFPDIFVTLGKGCIPSRFDSGDPSALAIPQSPKYFAGRCRMSGRVYLIDLEAADLVKLTPDHLALLTVSANIVLMYEDQEIRVGPPRHGVVLHHHSMEFANFYLQGRLANTQNEAVSGLCEVLKGGFISLAEMASAHRDGFTSERALSHPRIPDTMKAEAEDERCVQFYDELPSWR